MKKENNVVKRNTFITSPLEGEGGRRPGEGVLNKEHFIGTPSSPLWGTSKAEKLFDNPPTPLRGTSPARGAEKAALCAKHPARGEVNGGFTLIELLVVVLIIAILAAVAVPQYRLAVAKSRYMQLIVLARAFYNAQQVYALNNGAWTADLEKLDIALPVYDANTKEFYESEKKKFYCLYGHGDTEELYCGFSTGEPRLWLLRSKAFQPHCYFDTTATDAALAEKVCKSVCNGITPVAWYGNVKFCTIKS